MCAFEEEGTTFSGKMEVSDGKLKFSFTVIDGGGRDGCATLKAEEGVNDFGGKMEVLDGKPGT